MKKRILVIVVVLMMLLLMTVPVSAVKPPVDSQGNIWTALEALQNQITAIQNQITELTQRVDTIENSPMPEYRAGTYTTPFKDEAPWIAGYSGVQTVTFSHPMPDTNYRVSVTNADTSKFTQYNCVGTCFLIINSKTTTGFTFSYQKEYAVNTPEGIWYNHKFDYIAIADN